mmetsp:Transcript_39679/g.63487  ORF Transcript_39679/g.63487 Transcript_39679/m.63487 type:complete len:274 (+) Transcript_39679:19-840(+)
MQCRSARCDCDSHSLSIVLRVIAVIYLHSAVNLHHIIHRIRWCHLHIKSIRIPILLIRKNNRRLFDARIRFKHQTKISSMFPIKRHRSRPSSNTLRIRPTHCFLHGFIRRPIRQKQAPWTTSTRSIWQCSSKRFILPSDPRDHVLIAVIHGSAHCLKLLVRLIIIGDIELSQETRRIPADRVSRSFIEIIIFRSCIRSYWRCVIMEGKHALICILLTAGNAFKAGFRQTRVELIGPCDTLKEHQSIAVIAIDRGNNGIVKRSQIFAICLSRKC